MDENMMETTEVAEPEKETQLETETAPAPSESHEIGESAQAPQPVPASAETDDAEKKEEARGDMEALAREFLQLLRREQKAERSIGGESAAGNAGAGLSQKERDNLADWNRRWPELAMTPGEWKEKRR
ncbi:MAG: hypothetical protein IKT60_03725 [Clostridia bacterium]|nr:hypothetical protein [Clostridia bacterium]